MSDTHTLTGLEAYRAKLEAGEIERAAERKTPFEKVRAKPTSLKLRIIAMCCQCVGWEDGGQRPHGVVQSIRSCTAPTCPLFEVRPYQRSDGADEDGETEEGAGDSGLDEAA